ncbi:hypothetical protein M231_05458 [Tremella mesenterica]|uniref:Uncharacterized protein n=1 Tax=Tremella mesenterica TaxID=5217 RepID=A0A4Q1BIA0_TREME|nr:hypothetical protein M231_05458 [Tremella mesenterica]
MAAERALPDGLTGRSLFASEDFVSKDGKNQLIFTKKACSTLLGCQETLLHLHYLANDNDDSQPVHSLTAYTFSGKTTLTGEIQNLSPTNPSSARPTNSTVQRSDTILVHSDAFAGAFDSLAHQSVNYRAYEGGTDPLVWKF